MTRSVLLPLLASTLLLAACGQAALPDAPSPDAAARARPTPAAPLPAGPGGPAAPGAPGSAQATLAAVQAAWGQVRTLSANYDLWEKGASETETAKVTFYFQKPGKYRYEVSQASSAIKNGSTSVFDRQTRQITSRLAGALSFLPIKGNLDDARSKSARGYTLDQTDYATQTELLLQGGAAVKLLSPAGSSMPALELAHPSRYPGVEAMRVLLDAQKNLPVSFELIANGQSVYKKRFSNLNVNPSIASDKFSL